MKKLQVNNELDNPDKVHIFLMALGYQADGQMDHVRAHLAQETGISNYMALGLHAPIAVGFQKAAEGLAARNFQSLDRKQLEAALREIIPSGRASEDQRDNALDVYDKIVAAIAQGKFGFESTAQPIAPNHEQLTGGTQEITSPDTSLSTGKLNNR